MMLNRKCAQRSWDREVNDVSFIGCRYFHFPHLFGGAARVYTASLPVSPGILCGTGSEPHITNSFQAAGVVIRSQKLEQLQKPVAPFDPKTHAQGQGHRLWAQRRHKPGASFSPKRAFHEEDQPPTDATVRECGGRSPGLHASAALVRGSSRGAWPTPIPRPNQHKLAAP